jgi:hypothetical protein
LDNNPKHTAKTMQEWLRGKSLKSLRAWTWTQSKISGETWKYLQCNAPHPTWQVERICREKWEKLPKYRCAKLVALYPRSLNAIIPDKVASTKYWVKGLKTYVNVIFQFRIFYKLAQISKKRFLLCHYVVLRVNLCSFYSLFTSYLPCQCDGGTMQQHFKITDRCAVVFTRVDQRNGTSPTGI